MYKWCAVPECTNTTIKTPEKLFVTVPKKPKMRKKWLLLGRRNPDSIVNNSTIFFCEDHFDMETDMANYCQFKMGFSKKILMVEGTVPSKFNWSRKKIMCDKSSPSAPVKRQRKQLFQEFKDIDTTMNMSEFLTVHIKEEPQEIDCLKVEPEWNNMSSHDATHKIQNDLVGPVLQPPDITVHVKVEPLFLKEEPEWETNASPHDDHESVAVSLDNVKNELMMSPDLQQPVHVPSRPSSRATMNIKVHSRELSQAYLPPLLTSLEESRKAAPTRGWQISRPARP